MKKLSIGIFAAVAIIAAVPFGMGIFTQQTLQQQYVFEDTLTKSVYTLDLVDYRRGWFSSKAKIKVTVNTQTSSNDPLFLLTALIRSQVSSLQNQHFSTTFDVNIKHGPLVFTTLNGKSRLQLGIAGFQYQINLSGNDATRQVVDNVIGKQPLATGESILHFSGDLSNQLQSLKIHFEDKTKDMKVDWQGFNFTADVSKQYDRVNVNFISTPVNISNFNRSDTLSISSIRFQTHSKRGLADLWYGTSELSLDSIRAKVYGNKTSVSNIKISKNQTEHQQKFDVKVTYSIGNYSINDKTYGPVNIAFKLTDVNAIPFRQLADTVNQQNINSMQLQQQMLFLMQLIPQALQIFNGTSLQLNANVDTPLGIVNADAQVTAAKQINATTLDPLLLIREFTGDANISVSQEVVKRLMYMIIYPIKIDESTQRLIAKTEVNGKMSNLDAAIKAASQQATDQRINQYLDAGLITKAGNTYQTKLGYHNGKLTANGVQIFDAFAPTPIKTSRAISTPTATQAFAPSPEPMIAPTAVAPVAKPQQ